MVMRDFLQNLCVLQLGLEHILLVSLANSIPRLRRLFHLAEKLITAQKGSKSLLDVRQLVVHTLQVFDYVSSH